MFKKIAMATALSTAVLFTGAFSAQVDAQANQDQQNYQVNYSINGNKASSDEFQNKIDKYFQNCSFNWKKQNTNNAQQEQNQEPAEENKEQNTNKDENNQTEQPKPEQEQSTSEKQPQQEQAQNNGETEQVEENQGTDQEQSDQQLSQFEQEVVELTNEQRTNNGLEPLKADTELSKVAREKSADMARNNYFSHDSPTYGSPFDMMKEFGVSYQTAGENIAKGQKTPEEVVNGWMNSEGHRENILNADFTHIGVGYVEDGNVWTQQFIGK